MGGDAGEHPKRGGDAAMELCQETRLRRRKMLLKLACQKQIFHLQSAAPLPGSPSPSKLLRVRDKTLFVLRHHQNSFSRYLLIPC